MMKKLFISNNKAQSLMVLISLSFMAMIFLGGCASNMTGYYSGLRQDIVKENYEDAADKVSKYKEKYGTNNVLMFYLDTGIINHYAGIYEISQNNFEAAKKTFDDYYTKSISAAAASFVYNDSSLPYYGEDFESIHITVFNALNYILNGQDNEAVVEARQADLLFKSQSRKVYKDDGFVRYFMGLVYENGGYLNDARVSYSLAISAYENGINNIKPPKDLIDDAYSAALKLGINDIAKSIKAKYPAAQKKDIAKGYGECIVIDYNGIVPQKVENNIEFALFRAFPYIDANQAEAGERQDYQRAKSATISAFANDYIKVSFPAYKRIAHRVNSFTIEFSSGVAVQSYMAQDIAQIAEKTLESQVAKIYTKTIARAAVKYILGKVASAEVEKQYGSGYGSLARMASNLYSSLSSIADTRGWNTLPENILMSRFYLPEGENKIIVRFLDSAGNTVKKSEIKVNVKSGKKNFIVISSPM
jgi:hypothetical protein